MYRHIDSVSDLQVKNQTIAIETENIIKFRNIDKL